MMDSLTLEKLCDFKCFLGVFPCDKLPTEVPWPSCLIANTQASNNRGEHWIGIFLNKEGYGDIFCSYALPTARVFTNFMNTHSISWNYNTKRIQGNGTTCGQYVAFFLYSRNIGISLTKFVSLFSRNYEENDAIVTAFINGRCNVTTKVFDPSLFE
jgi:hypothetical protein